MKQLFSVSNVPAYIERYVKIRDSKNLVTRIALEAAHDFVTRRYASYELGFKFHRLDSIKKKNKAIGLSEQLRACYKIKTKALQRLKGAIDSAQPPRRLKNCPMCGITRPTTYDHYMPAVIFPEYSVHPLNLVPCCSGCNSIKDDDWLCGEGRRQYLHAYMDSLPDMVFLNVEIVERPPLRGVGASFSISKPRGMDESLWKLIEKHFERLKLIERYTKYCNDEIVDILASGKAYLEGGDTNVRGFLKRTGRDYQAVWGKNHWVALLMLELSDYPGLDRLVR